MLSKNTLSSTPNILQSSAPPTALSPHALPHPAHPTPHHPKHTTVSQKNCTYHTKITTPQKNFKQKSILPTSLPSVRCRRRGRPPYALPPPHLPSPHNHRPHPHPPCGPRNPNLTNLGFPDPHQPLSDPEKHRFRIRHPQPRHSRYPHPRPQHSHTRFRHDFTSDKIRLRLRSLPLPPKDHPTNPQARPLRPPQSQLSSKQQRRKHPPKTPTHLNSSSWTSPKLTHPAHSPTRLRNHTRNRHMQCRFSRAEQLPPLGPPTTSPNQPSPDSTLHTQLPHHSCQYKYPNTSFTFSSLSTPLTLAHSWPPPTVES